MLVGLDIVDSLLGVAINKAFRIATCMGEAVVDAGSRLLVEGEKEKERKKERERERERDAKN